MNIVLIGNEGHTGVAVSAIRKNPELKLCGIASADPVDQKNFQALSQEFSCDIFTDRLRMLDELKPDVAVIGSRLDLNGTVSLECLSRGVNCFTEKSIAHSLPMLDKLENAAKSSGARIVGMHTMRYDPQFLAARDAVAAGLIGRPRIVYGRKSYKFGASRPEYYRSRQTYGGTILWVAIHALDTAIWVCGDVSGISAYHNRDGNFGYGECESSVAMSFAFKNGGVGAITADFYQPKAAARHGDDQIRFAGELGVVEVIGDKAFIRTHDEPERELPQEAPRDFFSEFCAELRGDGKCLISMEDTFTVTRAALRALESADRAMGL